MFTKKIRELHEKREVHDTVVGKEENEEQMDAIELVDSKEGSLKEDGETSDSDESWSQTSGLQYGELIASNDTEENVRFESSGLHRMQQNHSTKSTKNLSKSERVEGKFACAECFKRFTSDYHLKNHIKFKHLKIFDYKCNVCQHAYHNKFILETHKCRAKRKFKRESFRTIQPKVEEEN